MRTAQPPRHPVIVIEAQEGRYRPVVRDTGIPVQEVLSNLTTEANVEHVRERFPDLTAEDIDAVIEFASNAVEPGGRDIRDLGWTIEDAARVRHKFLTFADDWDDPVMDVYDAAYSR